MVLADMLPQTTQMKHFYQSIQGWMDFEDVYREAVQRAPFPAVFVEVGTWLGRSAAFMAVEIVNSGKAIEFHCVDTWDGRGFEHNKDLQAEVDAYCQQIRLFEMFRNNLQMGGVWDQVIIHRMTSLEAAATFATFADGSVDFCFIDASHLYADVKQDIAAWLPKIRSGGILAGHDYSRFHSGVMQAVQEAFGQDFRVQGHCWLHSVPAVVK